mmetsp:Transcript_25671/g.41923  ORF Transcript_25671/g.41923 Transcript_25671/m.41923 type:complete len:297 (-) Transcript_25671:209-1099(-)
MHSQSICLFLSIIAFYPFLDVFSFIFTPFGVQANIFHALLDTFLARFITFDTSIKFLHLICFGIIDKMRWQFHNGIQQKAATTKHSLPFLQRLLQKRPRDISTKFRARARTQTKNLVLFAHIFTVLDPTQCLQHQIRVIDATQTRQRGSFVHIVRSGHKMRFQRIIACFIAIAHRITINNTAQRIRYHDLRVFLDNHLIESLENLIDHRSISVACHRTKNQRSKHIVSRLVRFLLFIVIVAPSIECLVDRRQQRTHDGIESFLRRFIVVQQVMNIASCTQQFVPHNLRRLILGRLQ